MNIITWIFTLLQILTGVGILVFWVTWFRKNHTESWLPPGFVEHERAFVVPDSVLAALLIISGSLEISGSGHAVRVAYLAAGMMTFLGLIDLTYFVQNGLVSRERGGAGNLAIVSWVLFLALCILVYYR